MHQWRRVCKGAFSILWFKKLPLTSWKPPPIHTHSLPYCPVLVLITIWNYFTSFVYLVTHCLSAPLWKLEPFLSVPADLSISNCPWPLERVQNYLYKEGRKKYRKKSVYWAPTICSVHINSFPMPSSWGIHYWFCLFLYIQGPTLRMLSDLAQGHSALTSMSPLTSYPLHSWPRTGYLPFRNLIHSSPWLFEVGRLYSFAGNGTEVKFLSQS